MSQPQPSIPPYGKRVTILLLSVATLGLILCAAEDTNAIVGTVGAALFMGAMTTALIVDWSGVITLRQLIDWQRIHGRKRTWLIIAWVCLFPLFFCVYFARVAIHQFRAQGTPVPPTPVPKRVKVGLVVGLLVVCIGLISAFGSAAEATPGTQLATPAQTQATPSPVTQVALTDVPSALPAPTPTPVPTTKPTSAPTPKPQPTPTPEPTCQAVNNNPWCFNFSPGNLIYNPPADFCSYFACIGNFWNGRGYVNECQDGEYSKSGGIRGDCSYHGGELRPLYSH